MASTTANVVDLRGKVGSLPAPLQPDTDGLLLRARALPESRNKSSSSLATTPRPRFSACALTERGDSLALVSDAGQVFVLQLEPHRRRFVQLDALDGPGAAATWMARDRRLLFVAQRDGGVRCYDLATRASAATLVGNRARVRSLSVRVGSEQLAAASADGVVLWALGSLQRRRLLGAAPYGTIQAGYSPDERTLVAAAADGTFTLWAAKSMQPVGSFTLPRRRSDGEDGLCAPINSSNALSSSSAQAAADGDAGLYPSCFAITLDSRSIVVGTTSPALLLVYDRTCLALRHGVALPRCRRGVVAVHALPDARTAAVVCADGSVSVVDFEAAAEEGEIALSTGANASGMRLRAEAVSVDARGNVLAVITDDGAARVYDLAAARAAMAKRRAANAQGGSGAVAAVAAAAAAGGAIRKVSAGELAVLPDSLLEGAFPLPVHLGAAAAAATKAAARGGSRAKTAAVASQLDVVAPPRGAAAAAARKAGGGGSSTVVSAAPAAVTATAAAAAALRTQPLAPNAAAVSRRRLEEMLTTFGEFPARYRLLIWWVVCLFGCWQGVVIGCVACMETQRSTLLWTAAACSL